jgi:hypothetical protein
MKELGVPQFPKDLLLINDGSIEDADFKRLAQTHRDSGLFPKVETRIILQFADRAEWPWTVNHVWRTTALIVAGEYGLKFDSAEYYCWFYFEPDVTPLNKDFAHILEQGYILRKRQFMGRMHVTVASNGQPVRHMNGACCYPIANQWYNEPMMLADGVPWDVAGLNTQREPARMAEVPDTAYEVQVGAEGFVGTGSLSGGQRMRDGSVKPITFTPAEHILHHGCKDGSLIDALRLRHGTQGEPAALQGGNESPLPSGGHETPAPRSASVPTEEPSKKLHWKKLQKLDKLAPQVRTDLSLNIPKRITMRKFGLKREEMEYILSKTEEKCVS